MASTAPPAKSKGHTPRESEKIPGVTPWMAFPKKMSSHQKGIQLQICHNHCSFLAFFNDMSFFSLCLLCSAQGAQGAHEEPNAAEVAADAADEASQIALRCQPWNAKSLR